MISKVAKLDYFKCPVFKNNIMRHAGKSLYAQKEQLIKTVPQGAQTLNFVDKKF